MEKADKKELIARTEAAITHLKEVEEHAKKSRELLEKDLRLLTGQTQLS